MGQRPILSVLMPVFNERRTVLSAIDGLEACEFTGPVELVLVDDGSTDGTTELVRERVGGSSWIRPVFHERNRGKGGAIRTALDHATGRFSCIYDADLEYDPQDMETLLEPLAEGRTDVSYGIRAFGGHAAYSYWYVVGNRMLTLFSNVLFNSYVRDIMTCYKMMETDLFRSLDIRSSGFELEAEITAKLLMRGYRIYEVPVSYRARSQEEGKKIRTSDGWRVLSTLIRIRFGERPPGRLRARPLEEWRHRTAVDRESREEIHAPRTTDPN